MAARLQLADRVLPYADLRWRPADPPAPALHLEDVSAIPFLTGIAGVEEYQHRARLRTAAGDAYAAVTGSEAAYDDYCTQRLRLAPVSRIPVRASDASSALAVAEGCMRGAAFERATALARRNGRLVIHPYMAIEPVWQLARRIAERAGAAVTVLGPRRRSRGSRTTRTSSTSSSLPFSVRAGRRRPGGERRRAASPPTCARWRRSTRRWA